MLVQWWRYLIMLLHQPVVTGSKQTNQSMNQMIDSNFCACYQWERLALQWQIWSTFVTLLWCSKVKITDGTRIFVLVRVLWDMISKIYRQFWQSFFKKCTWNQLQFNPIKIIWRKMVCVQCVWNQCQWQSDVCIHYDVSLYQRILKVRFCH